MGIGVGVLVSVAVYFLGRSRRRHVALDPTRKIALPLIEKEELSHDTRRFRFGLPNEDDVLGLPVGQHVSLSYTSAEGKLVARSYTPTSSGLSTLWSRCTLPTSTPSSPTGGRCRSTSSRWPSETPSTSAAPRGSSSTSAAGTLPLPRGPRLRPSQS